MFGTRSFSYYGSKSRWLWQYFSMIPRKHYKVFLDACMGSGGIIATAEVLDVEKRIGNEKDRNVHRMHMVLRDNYEGFLKELKALQYDAKFFKEMKRCAESLYAGFSDEKAAAVEYCQIQYSFNNNRQNFRRNCEAFIGRSQRNAMFSLEDFSQALHGVEILNEDCLDVIPEFLHKKDVFIFQDSPYRPALRKSPYGYSVDTDEEWHEKFLFLMVNEYKKRGIAAEMMICCYVDFEEEYDESDESNTFRGRFISRIRNDVYCKVLMPIGFKLLRIVKTVKPTVNRKKFDGTEGNSGKKSPATECVFFNFELPYQAYEFISGDDIFTFNEVFG